MFTVNFGRKNATLAQENFPAFIQAVGFANKMKGKHPVVIVRDTEKTRKCYYKGKCRYTSD